VQFVRLSVAGPVAELLVFAIPPVAAVPEAELPLIVQPVIVVVAAKVAVVPVRLHTPPQSSSAVLPLNVELVMVVIAAAPVMASERNPA
jgi:hypothetical protein